MAEPPASSTPGATEPEDDTLTPATILAGRHQGAGTFLRSVECHAQLDSTMDTARERLHHASSDTLPLLVLAEEQTAGRGRMQRPWVAPPGSALLFSLALRPTWLAPTHAFVLIWLVGVALCEGIAESTGLRTRLKWPNDVLLLGDTPAQSWKVAGLLLEMGSTSDTIEWAVIGCGLNINMSPPPDAALRYPATCLAAACGKPSLPRLPILRALLAHMESWYERVQRGEHDALFAAWRALLHTRGQQVRVETEAGTIQGLAEDVEPSGALRVRDATGVVHHISSGDVLRLR